METGNAKPADTVRAMRPQQYADQFRMLVSLLGTAAILYAIVRFPLSSIEPSFWILAIVTITCSAHLNIRIPTVKAGITVSDTFIFLTLLMFGGEAGIMVATAEGMASATRVSKKVSTWIFNTAMMALSTFLTMLALRGVFGSIQETTSGDYSASFVMMVGLMALVQYITNAGIAAVYSALRTSEGIAETWTKGYLWTSLTYLAGASAAGLIARLSGRTGIYALLVTAPIIAIVYFTYRTYIKNFEVSQQKAELAQQHVAELSHHIAEQERISKALRESEEHFRTAFNHAVGMALVGLDGSWLQVNQSLCQMLGYTEEEMLATNFQAITHPYHLVADKRGLSDLLEGRINSAQQEKRFIHTSGYEVWVLQSVSLVRDAENQPLHYIFQVQDITERRQAEESVRHAAFHDALTGLPNRVLLTDRLSLAVERAKRNPHYQFAVLFIDLDRFKIVNDSMGHQYGDQLLIELSKRLSNCVRAVDTVARLGGDEFAILLDGIESLELATQTAGRIQEVLTRPFNLRGQEVFTSASIGIAVSSSGYERPEDILRDSDTAMYRAKFNGKARHEVFDQDMHTSVVEALQLENDLRRAVERQEFRLHYQPIVSLATGQISGCEALVRWMHPQRGMVSPGEFIPLAEETGLIIPLGMWVLQEATAQVARWQRQFNFPAPLTISVNLSPRQLKQPDLVEEIERILQCVQLPPSSLRLEITESLVMEDPEIARDILHRLKQIGLQLSLDDFGTGYSSLSYLHKFPFDILKIDRSFVFQIDRDQSSMRIVKTIMMLASELEMDVVAEGVETSQHSEHLKALNCTFAQGYYFARPMDAAEVEKLLVARMKSEAASQPNHQSQEEQIARSHYAT